MKQYVFAAIFLVAALAAPISAATPVFDPPPGFVTLCYHDIPTELNELAPADAMPVVAGKLIDQFDWLRANGYSVIGVDDVLAFRAGVGELPEKSVLLSFDDGYKSFYTVVFPLLKAYNYKAVLALQTGWLSTPDDRPVVYGDDQFMPRSYFLAWDEVREMADSGLVELASHSHDLHRGHLGMPQGVLQPAGAALAYDEATKSYETDELFYRRVRADVARSADVIFEKTGRRPRVMVWPYGQYNQLGVRAALDAGYALTASLALYADGPTIPRYLMYDSAVLHDAMVETERGFAAGHSAYEGPNLDAVYVDLLRPVYTLQRVVHVDLDMVYDPDPEQQYRNVSALFDRVEALGGNVVYLQAYADPDGNGTTDSLYFPNRHLPMRADLFNYVSWQLKSRLGQQVYAWMPVLGFEIPGRPLVEATGPGREGSTYDRLTPFDAENRRIVKEIFEDLARHSSPDGILYHDDAVIGDYEDAGPAAAAWLEEIGLPLRLETIRADSRLMHYFSRMKSKYLIDFTNDLTASMRKWSPPLLTARNMYAPVVLNPKSEEWFGQNICDFLDNYDYTGLMAMPYMEGEDKDPDGWLRKLAGEVLKYPKGAQKTVFELQAVDWRHGNAPIPGKTLARQMRLLQLQGIGNIGYYPEDPYKNHPDINTIYPSFSLQSNIYDRRIYDPAAKAAAEETAPQESPSQIRRWYVEPKQSSPHIPLR